MATQAKLPGTLPTPAAARSNLRLVREEVRRKRGVAESMKARVDAAKEELKAADAETEEVEGDLLDADEGTPLDVSAGANHHKALRRLAHARTDLDKVRATQRLAKSELKEALGRLRAAREDMEAIREGRRR